MAGSKQPASGPVDHTDLDPTTGESFGNTGAEPELNREPQPGDVVHERPPRVDPDEARAAIYATHSADRNAERAGLDSETLAQVEMIEDFAAGRGDGRLPADALADAMAREAAGEAGDAPPAAPRRAASSSSKFNLNIYGETREVSEADALTAARVLTGRDDITAEEARTIVQKEAAADVRQRALNDRERQLTEYAGELNDYRERLVSRTPAPAGKPGTPPTDDTPPSQQRDVAPPTVDRAKVEKAVADLYSGDVTRGTEALLGLVTDVMQGRAQSPTPPSAEEVAQRAAVIVRETETAEEREQHRVAANQLFRSEFADVLGNDDLRVIAQARMQKAIADPANAGKPYEDIARDVGNAIRTSYLPDAAPAPRRGGGDELAQRRDLKGKLPVRPGATSARVPVTDQEPQPTDSSDVVRQMRISRGQPV